MANENGSNADGAAALAARLRLLQVDLADQDDEKRRQFLREELQRALASIVPSERQSFLEDLQARFPTWEGQAPPDTRAKDPNYLIDRLIEVWPSLPEAHRRALADRLQRAGVAAQEAPPVTDSSGLPATVGAELGSKLGLNASDRLNSARAMDLLTLLAEVVSSIDKAVWSQWQQEIAPQSVVKRPGILQQTMARFITGSPLISKGQIVDETVLLQRLVVALVASVSQTGRFASEHFRTLSPDEIRGLVGSSLVGTESRCWRKYIDLYESMDAGVTYDAIRRAITEFVEKLINNSRPLRPF